MIFSSFRLGFFFFGGGGGRLTFSGGLRFSQGIKIIPSELSFLSGCSKFFRRWGVESFSGGGSVFWGRIHFKLAFSHDKVSPCRPILDNTTKRTNMPFKIILEEASVPIASAQQYHIYILFESLYTFS